MQGKAMQGKPLGDADAMQCNAMQAALHPRYANPQTQKPPPLKFY